MEFIFNLKAIYSFIYRSLQLSNSLISNLGKQPQEVQDIGIKFPFNPSLVQMPRFNIKTARNEYDFRNTVFKRRNIRGKEGRAAIIKSKRLASLNESPNKEQTWGIARSQLKDGVIDDIFKINHGAWIPQRKHPSKVKSNNEILATIRGIHQVDHNNQMLMQVIGFA